MKLLDRYEAALRRLATHTVPIDRINAAADVGADMGLVFPRNDDELRQAPKLAKVPLVYVMSRGNRDQRPLPTTSGLEAMGYKA